MPDPKTAAPPAAPADPGEAASAQGHEPDDRGFSDFLRRAVSAGVEAAARSKDDVRRILGAEMRGWLDRLDLDKEITKALSRTVVEIKAEIRFRPTDDGELRPDVTVKTETRS